MYEKGVCSGAADKLESLSYMGQRRFNWTRMPLTSSNADPIPILTRVTSKGDGMRERLM